jgi:hypothetical protein
VSKSLPALFQGNANTWKIMNEDKSKEKHHEHEGFDDGMSFTTDDHRTDWDKYLSNLFTEDFDSRAGFVEYKSLTKMQGHKEWVESIGQGASKRVHIDIFLERKDDTNGN